MPLFNSKTGNNPWWPYTISQPFCIILGHLMQGNILLRYLYDEYILEDQELKMPNINETENSSVLAAEQYSMIEMLCTSSVHAGNMLTTCWQYADNILANANNMLARFSAL